VVQYRDFCPHVAEPQKAHRNPALVSTKFVLEGLSESFALEPAPFGLKVTEVEPGFFRTDFLDRSSALYANASIQNCAQASHVRRAFFMTSAINQQARSAHSISSNAALDHR
jgi:NAD(P)-dependent dehydrogenase (short-subunit alcohol dehydrogenase family)